LLTVRQSMYIYENKQYDRPKYGYNQY